MERLMQLLEKEFERKSESKDSQPRSEKKIAKLFVYAVKSINHLFPQITRPIVTGFYSHEPEAMGSISESEAMGGPCTLHEGKKDPLGKLITAKPIGPGKSHPRGSGESTCKVILGGTEKKILATSYLQRSGNDLIPEPRPVVIEAGDRPVVFFEPR
jgi:hypothetical protein